MNKRLGDCTPTSCPKAGIKIHESDNNYKRDPFNDISYGSTPVNFHNTTLDSLDLDLNNYSLEDLYHLFNMPDGALTEASLKNAKQIVLFMHPDKCRLDSKYFIFFSKAYKRLYGIYQFQNKSSKKTTTDENYFYESEKVILDNMIEKNKHLKDPANFNSWFNQAFEKHRLENPNDEGYGDWLKSDEGIMNINENVTKGNMNEIFEQKKKQIQALSVYTGVTNLVSSSNLGGTLLNGGDNYTSDGYTDLRQAYTETLIPVTQEDYDKMPKFNNMNEYKTHRDRLDIAPLSKEKSEDILLKKANKLDQESTALAFKYALESERVSEKRNLFWGEIRQLTNK